MDYVSVAMNMLVDELDKANAKLGRVRALLEQWEKDIGVSEKLGISTMWSGPAMAKHLREELEGK